MYHCPTTHFGYVMLHSVTKETYLLCELMLLFKISFNIERILSF